jgi:FlaA1/EpsC-like NDP-sugar epimerase
MGDPVLILELARALIACNGLVVDQDIMIKFSGIRPGEKLYEELACDDDRTRPTGHPKIRVWELPAADPAVIAQGLRNLADAAQGSAQDAIASLVRWVPEYQPQGASSAAAPRLRLVPADEPSAVEAA